MNNFKEQLEKKEVHHLEKKRSFFRDLKNKFQIFKKNIFHFIKKIFVNDRDEKVNEVALKTVILVDMAKIEYVDLKTLLSGYEKESQLFLIAKAFNKFDTQRVSKLPYRVEYIQVVKKVSTGKQLKLTLKKLRNENKYRVVTIKGRGSHLIDTYLPIKKEPKTQNIIKKERWTPFKELFHLPIAYPSLAEIEEQKRLSVLNNHLVLWDIENISHNNVAKIVSKLDTPNSFYCVSVEPLGEKATKKLFLYTLKYNLRIKVGHFNSDDEIVGIIEKNYKAYKLITIISSDTDFAPIIKKLLKEGKKVQVIGIDSQKKGILMKNNIGNSNLKIITI
jgi:hypothetical protein